MKWLLRLWLVPLVLGLTTDNNKYTVDYDSQEDVEMEPKFKIKYNDGEIPRTSAQRLIGESYNETTSLIDYGDESYELVEIGNYNGDYICLIPKIDSQKIVDKVQQYLHATPESTDLKAQVVPLLSHFFDSSKCIYTSGLHSEYWTYGYCFGDKVVQFHENFQVYQTTGKHIPEYPNYIFVLGQFPGSSTTNPPMIKNHSNEKSRVLNVDDFSIIDDPLSTVVPPQKSQKALKHVLTDGELCDLTQLPRSVEIIYRCDPHVDFNIGIISLQEMKTCEYQMIINMRSLCQFPEFTPSQDEEKAFDIVCNPVSVEGKSISNLSDLVVVKSAVDENNHNPLNFPLPKVKYIDVNDFNIQPAGTGFYWGRSKSFDISSDLYDKRSILVYNGDERNPHELIAKIARMFSNSMELKIYAPDANDRFKLASWSDSFIAYYELYDFTGNLLNLVKIIRDGNRDTTGIDLQLIDPLTMLDQDGDPVDISKPDPNRILWHYESYFFNGATGNPNRQIKTKSSTDDDTEFKTITHTVTVQQQDAGLSYDEVYTVDTSEYDPLENEFFKQLAHNLGVDDHEVYRVFNEMGIDLNFDDNVHDEL